MIAPTSDSGDGSQSFHLDGNIVRASGVITVLPKVDQRIVLMPPCPQGPIRLEGKVVVITRSYCNYVCQSGDLNWCQPARHECVYPRPHIRSSQLTEPIIAPCPYSAIGLQGEAMTRTCT